MENLKKENEILKNYIETLNSIMDNLQKENEALKSYIETLKNDRLVLLEQVKKYEKIDFEVGDDLIKNLQIYFEHSFDIEFAPPEIKGILRTVILEVFEVGGINIFPF